MYHNPYSSQPPVPGSVSNQPHMSMPVPTAVPIPGYMPPGAPVQMPPLPNTTTGFIQPNIVPLPGHYPHPHHNTHIPVVPVPTPMPGYATPNPAVPTYPHKKMKKSKVKKAMKYGLPIAGAGAVAAGGAYAVSKAVHHKKHHKKHHKHGSSSSSSSSSSSN